MSATTESSPQGAARRLRPSHVATAVFVAAMGCILAWGASRFPVEKGYSILGPQVIPYAVAVFLIFVGSVLGYQAMTGGFHRLEEGGPTTHAGRVGAAWVSAGLMAMSLLITVVGFVLSAALLFGMAARGFDSRHPVRDLGIGTALTLPVYWVFTSGLGVSLPSLVNAWI